MVLPHPGTSVHNVGDGAAPGTSVHNVSEGCSKDTGKPAKKQETGKRVRNDPLDFTPPDFNLFAEEDLSQPKPAVVETAKPASSDSSLDNISEETWKKLEQNDMTTVASRKRKEPVDDPSSVTPAYQPPPKRAERRPANLQSPYVDYTSNHDFKCSKDVCQVYDAVCAHGKTKSTRSSQDTQTTIVNFWEFFCFLEDLASSVKPLGHLNNTVAEIAIQVIDKERTKVKPIKQRVLPLRVATFLQSGQVDRNEVSRVFRRSENHLDRCEMVMFPVLEAYNNGSGTAAGHYYLLVLNLRARRFEVMDSMRTFGDNKRLRESCNKIMEGIKTLWRKHYPNSRKDIEQYKPVDIGVPKQSNNHDCGFHMIMHAQHWDGRTICNFKEEDMPNIRKILTHKWLTHPHNRANWCEKLNLSKPGEGTSK